MKFKLFFVFVGIAILIQAAFFFRDTALYSSYAKMSYEQFLAERPRKGAAIITNCQYDILETIYYQSPITKEIDMLYIPIRAVTNDNDSLYIIYKTKGDKKLIEYCMGLNEKQNRLENSWYRDKQVMNLISSPEYLKPQVIKGHIRTGFRIKSSEKENIRKRMRNLDEDFVMLDAVEKVNYQVLTILLIAIGLTMIVFPFIAPILKVEIYRLVDSIKAKKS